MTIPESAVKEAVVRRPAPGSGRRFRSRSWEPLVALGFLTPALVALVVLRLWPTATAIRGSLGGIDTPGLGAYRSLFADSGFYKSLTTTVVFNLIVNPVQVVAALAIAVLLSQRLPAQSFWRVLVFLPAAMPGAISAILWGIALRPSDGMVNALLSGLGIPKQPFLTSPSQAIWSLVLLTSWAGVGYWMIFIIAGLSDIPQTYYEAARIDGAGWWRTFFHITLPLLRRPLAFVLVSDTAANFRLFAPVQILTEGGPRQSTNLLMYDIYRQAYSYANPEGAYAEVMILLAVMIVIVAVQFRLLRSES